MLKQTSLTAHRQPGSDSPSHSVKVPSLLKMSSSTTEKFISRSSFDFFCNPNRKKSSSLLLHIPVYSARFSYLSQMLTRSVFSMVPLFHPLHLCNIPLLAGKN